jgi:CRP-like cAMP-binding protein
MNPLKQPRVTGNLFLDALPWESLRALWPALQPVRLRKAQVVAESGVPGERIYFPLDAVISTVSRMADGSAVEVGLAGAEGFSPASLAFGAVTGAQNVMVQIAGGAYVMSAEAFAARMAQDGALREQALSYAHYSFAAATQFAACNRLHTIDERYARWLLMTDDRVGNGEFLLTQEYSAQMLGVRRAGVTTIAGNLSRAGLISYRRGHISVRDHDALNAASCECYDAVNDELHRLLGYDIRDPARRQHSKALKATAAGAV